ncbi:PilT/PilU family type 4a pilus ATPase [Candidatus Gracilibacteria bacterium]|nr:PilT/PilU family type 4a pilus ATPase [Candidatus Gracilibacteria bacterium]
MGFFDKVKTSFDDDITPNEEISNKKNEIKNEVKKEKTPKKSDSKPKEKTTSAPKTVVSDGSKGKTVEDDFMAALNQNVVLSDKPKKQKSEKEEEKKSEPEDKIEIPENNIFQDQLEEKKDCKKEEMTNTKEEVETEEIQTIETGISGEDDLTIDKLLDAVIENGASDLHFGAGEKVALRINGSIEFINEIEQLSKKTMLKYVSTLMGNDKKIIERYKETKEMDCAYEHPSGVNFRVNLFYKRKKMAGVLRKIASQAMKIEDLGIPQSIKQLLKKNQGLLLVTGPTGSGKSTSMQSMLQFINETRVEHILTIEDPIEFIFTNDKSIFSQREVGTDTDSFHNALKAALREDPDIIMIGEMRDQETINAAMHLAETGHLVISTLHTSSAAQTISRLVSTYPSDEQDQVQSRLADALIGVLSQRLVKTVDGKGRIGLFEVLIVNTAVRNIIRTGDMGQMGNAMLSGRSEGMVRMFDYAEDLAAEGKIPHDCYQGFFKSE